YELSPYQKWAADFSGDGSIDEGDALSILKEALNALLPKTQSIANNTFGMATVSFGNAKYETDDVIVVPIQIDGRNDIYASGFEISYDSQVLSVLEASSVISSSLLATNFNETGTVKISTINTNGLVNSLGKIIYLKFKIKDEVNNLDLEIKEVRLFSRDAGRIQTEINPEIVEVAAVPKTFNLFQNYPNPFNPTTSIRFDLPEASEIKLAIYNMNGQEIRTLSETSMDAGTHSIVWGGRNNQGQVVPSGVYFYKLRVKSHQWESIKKMILIK
nr:T9SS type A sorting domain-containing protein [candidate division KSB1 bacterium]